MEHKLKNEGLTNSGMFFNNGKFDIDKAFDSYANSIKNAKKNITYFVEHPECDEDIDFWAIMLANEFKTLVETVREWNNSKK